MTCLKKQSKDCLGVVSRYGVEVTVDAPSLTVPAESRASLIVLERLLDDGCASQRKDCGEEGGMKLDRRRLIAVRLGRNQRVMLPDAVRASVPKQQLDPGIGGYVAVSGEREVDAAHGRVGREIRDDTVSWY